MLKDKVILLVDDEPSTLAATRAGLMERGFTVQAADGADAAMHALRSFKPSIIVSDLVMPGTNGFELFQRVKNESPYKAVPFVFLTGVDDVTGIRAVSRGDFDLLLQKPFPVDRLLQLFSGKLAR